jgi:predicted dienelactone hydrolase
MLTAPRRFALSLLASAALAAPALAQGGLDTGVDPLERYRAVPGATAVEVREFDLSNSRPTIVREIGVRAFVPAHAEGDPLHPLVVITGDVGHSRESMDYLGDHLASWGYVVAVLEHPSTSGASMRTRNAGQLDPALVSSDNRIECLFDVSHAITELLRPGRFDLPVDRTMIAVIGHGFGSYTALQTAGMVSDTSRRTDDRLRDRRVDTVIAMSPDGPVFFGVDDESFGRFEVPVLYMTGTQDRGRWTHNPALRRDPYLLTSNVPAALWVQEEGQSHFFTNDLLGKTGIPPAPTAQDDTKAAVTAWLDAFLRADPFAYEWLSLNGPSASSDVGVTWETKRMPELDEINPGEN